ncbi:hypothetical protein [Massilia frigida]|uniref:hypothetical protein n=1 Tax=Massilia frigida TaxID=2609281 RepID=UPI001423026C|nr:hypothetical protein [Massilia frigida]
MQNCIGLAAAGAGAGAAFHFFNGFAVVQALQIQNTVHFKSPEKMMIYESDADSN